MIAAIGAFAVRGMRFGFRYSSTKVNQPSATVFSTCAADGAFTVWCGFKNPEDLALTPDNKFLLATGFGGIPESTLNEMSIIGLQPCSMARLTS